LFFLSVFLRLRQEAFKPSRIVYAHYFSSSTSFEHLFFNHPENLDLKKKSTWQGMGVVWVGFLRNKKKPGKTQKVVEDYNNGNNVFLFVF